MSIDTETVPAIKVHVASVEPGVELGQARPLKERGYEGKYETFQLTANDPVQCILPEDEDRVEAFVWSLDNDVMIGTKQQVQASQNETTSTVTTTGTNPTPGQPAVAATGVPVQNVNAYPVQVVITASGATISAVNVNGVQVGSAAGTYVVPPYGSISISYTVATPTWVWSDASAAPSTSVTIITYPIGALLPAKANGGSIEALPVKDCNAVYAGVTTTASNSRVCVAAYYRC